MTAQLASSKPGCAQTGVPFCKGESPGANFHGPGSVAAESPRVMVSPEAAAGLGVERGGAGSEERGRRANKRNVPILRMPGEYHRRDARRHDDLNGICGGMWPSRR